MSKKILTALGLSALLESIYPAHQLPDEVFRAGNLEEKLTNMDKSDKLVVLCRKPDPEGYTHRPGYSHPDVTSVPVVTAGRKEHTPEYINYYSQEFLETLSDRFEIKVFLDEKTQFALALIGKKVGKGKKVKGAFEKPLVVTNTKAPAVNQEPPPPPQEDELEEQEPPETQEVDKNVDKAEEVVLTGNFPIMNEDDLTKNNFLGNVDPNRTDRI